MNKVTEPDQLMQEAKAMALTIASRSPLALKYAKTTSISRIRSKIEADGGAPYIKTVYGMGYQGTGGEAK